MLSMKRTFDIVGALGGLAFFALPMAVVALAILIDDGGPVLFRQERLGHHRKPFTILKFRSMRDGKVSRTGRIVRATGLDELPQFINILSGDLSVVGPRPLTQADVTRLGWTSRRHDFRWRMTPGLTGLAQVMGTRSARESLRLDRAYCRYRSLWMDARMVALSLAVNAFGKARVRRMLAADRASV